MRGVMIFLSTPSARRATLDSWHYGDNYKISIHALREEGDALKAFENVLGQLDFYPRPPRGGRRTTPARSWRRLYFYPRPPRGGRRRKPGLGDAWFQISIHALREEGDLHRKQKRRILERFLSTPSARRATRPTGRDRQLSRNFYPRPPRGGRHTIPQVKITGTAISIHALREEGDRPCAQRTAGRFQFLSTPSARRATQKQTFNLQGRVISIHALREEGDKKKREKRAQKAKISIHALREEGDGARLRRAMEWQDFYPRPPRGGRHNVIF